MNKINFSEIATKYEEDSLVQKSAAEILISLIGIDKDDNVLDLGCGTGHLTKRLREMTNGKVVGVDSSEGMIREAQRGKDGVDIIFEVKKAGEFSDFCDVSQPTTYLT